MNPTYDVVIGLECHAQLHTSSKLFCGCPIGEGGEPNSRICPVCLGHPGTLPILNDKAIRLGTRAALATSCTVNRRSVFERKQYFYPDLSKGYQISQYLYPLASDGQLTIISEGARRRVRINRIHLEEDAGKSIHTDDGTHVDYNRSGTPLAEIVTEPDLRSAEEAVQYLKMLHRVLVEAGVTLGDMEKGHFRCDANISIHKPGTPLGTRTEVKNLNSFRNVAKAIEYEVKRQTKVLEGGGTVVQETRTWKANRTMPMRGKEAAADYRYFPEPDLPALIVEEAELHEARTLLPNRPLDEWLLEQDAARHQQFQERHQLDDYVCSVLLANAALLAFFEATIDAGGESRAIANWVQGEVLRRLNDGDSLAEGKLEPAELVILQGLVDADTLSYRSAKRVFDHLWDHGGQAQVVVSELGLASVQDADQIRQFVLTAITNNPTQVSKYLNGNKRLIGFFIGEIMKKTRGRADPKLANRIVGEELDRLSE
jgi:aspartyl-tRNA(Asn)/glutamyl-tRNA(Gln) amidotransferase subunit B